MGRHQVVNVRAWLADTHLMRLFRDAGVVLSGNAGASLLSLVSIGLTARALGPELLGVLVLLRAYATLIEKLTTFQSGQAMIAFGAQLIEQDRRGDFRSLVKFSTLLDAAAASGGALLGMAAAYTYGQWRGWDAQQISMAVWYSATLLTTLTGTPKAVLRFFGRFHALAVQEIAASLIKLAGVTAACLMRGGLGMFLVVWMVTEVCGNLLLLAMGWRELWRQGHGSAINSPVRGITARCPGLWGFVWTTNLGGTIKGIAQEADTLVIGGVLGTMEAGLYKIAKQCTQIVMQMTDPLYRVLFPEIAKLWAKHDTASIQRLLRRLGLLGASIVACALLGVILVGRPFLALAFGDVFTQAHAVLAWQMAGMMVLIGVFPLASALPATGQYAAALKIQLAGLAFYLPALVLLTHAAGLVGAGAAYVLHQLVRALLLFRQLPWVVQGTPLAFRIGGGPQEVAPPAAGRRRVGMLTFHHVMNEGSVLQAYALQQSLQQALAPDRVEIIDYRPLQAELRDAKSAFVSVRHPRRLRYSIPSYFRLKRFADRALVLSPRRVVSDNYARALSEVTGRYDAVVVGSDEIWKVRPGAMNRQFPNIYWLNPELSCTKIAFAASANKLPYRTLPAGQREWMRKTLSSFDLIGARDRHTVDFLRWLGVSNGGIVSRVPDPTFMLNAPDRLDECRETLTRCGVDLRRPLLGLVLSDRALSRVVARYFRTRGFQIVAPGVYNAEADVNLMGRLDPLLWTQVFPLLRGCVTERFHPLVFCLRAGTPVLVVDHFDSTAGYDSKTSSLLEEFGLRALCYVNTHDRAFRMDALPALAEQVLARFDPEAVRRTARAKRQECEAFIGRIQALIHPPGLEER